VSREDIRHEIFLLFAIGVAPIIFDLDIGKALSRCIGCVVAFAGSYLIKKLVGFANKKLKRRKLDERERMQTMQEPTDRELRKWKTIYTMGLVFQIICLVLLIAAAAAVLITQGCTR
jgi:hypothetical protein